MGAAAKAQEQEGMEWRVWVWAGWEWAPQESAVVLGAPWCQKCSPCGEVVRGLLVVK